MNATLFRNLDVVNGSSPDWSQKLNKAVESGANFLMVLPEAESDQAAMDSLFLSGHVPEGLTRFPIIHLSQYLEPEDFDFLMLALDSGRKVILVDQLEVAVNLPPRIRTFMVYSATFGILSHHTALSDARASIARFEDSTFTCRHTSDACIYYWDDKWNILEEV
jgi:hypothetical protein